MNTVNILLVEDNEVNQIVASTLLRKWGISVAIANNGKEAIRLIQETKFSMVLMDLQMPEMDGYESTYQIRALEDLYFKTVPIIAFSASSAINTKEKAIGFGMTDFMTKPLRCDDLKEKIKTYVTDPREHSYERMSISIDFDLYTEGDPAFKQELVSLLIDNISELKQSLEVAVQENNPPEFFKTCHKASTAIKILNNKDLMEVVEVIKDHLKNRLSSLLHEKVALFNSLSDYLLKALQRENKKWREYPNPLQ
jgi:CheY-like chemotaxis protein